jgi:hypothetical protein
MNRMEADQQHARPYLVFVRAGQESHHQRMIIEDPGRNWDCCISWYIPRPDERLAEYECEGGDNKLEGFLEFWKYRPQPWPYRYTLLLDDDVYLRPGDISRFFELCERYGTYLSQPALRWFTQTTHKILIWNPVCILRRVSFAEAMAPCFSSAALEQLVHTFGWSKSTWGADWAWAHLLDGKQPIHVIDAVRMAHTRNNDGRLGLFYSRLKARGIDPKADERRILDMFANRVVKRTLADGHVFRPGIPGSLAPALLRAVERAKILARLRKLILRQWRRSSVRLEDRIAGAR